MVDNSITTAHTIISGHPMGKTCFLTTIIECKPHPVNDTIIIMSQTFAEFLLDTAETGNEILAVLEDIETVVETGGTDL